MAMPPRPRNPYASPSGQSGFQRGDRPVPHGQVYRRPSGISVLAVLNFIGGPLLLLLGVGVLFAATTGDAGERTLVTIVGAVKMPRTPSAR